MSTKEYLLIVSGRKSSKDSRPIMDFVSERAVEIAIEAGIEDLCQIQSIELGYLKGLADILDVMAKK